MRKPDLTSTIVAGAIGAVILYLVQRPLVCGDNCDLLPLGPYQVPIVGFLAGVGVQIGVRTLGVS